jgi:ribosomal protein S18 acetylase RimI-like enzyme
VVVTHVRRARPEDYADWFDLAERVAGEALWIGRELPLTRDELAFFAQVERADAAVFVVEVDRLIVGSLSVDVHSGIAQFGMWVDADRRGQGIGRVLLEACIDWASEHGAHKVTLEVWPHNERAIRLYRAMGFEIEGRKRRHYRRRNGALWDALLMGRVLDTTSPGSGLVDAPEAARLA